MNSLLNRGYGADRGLLLSLDTSPMEKVHQNQMFNVINVMSASSQKVDESTFGH